MRLLLFLGAAVTAATLTAATPFEAAHELYAQHKNNEAREAFTALSRAEPANAEAVFYLGRLAQRAKDYDTAVGFFENAIALDGTNARYYLELGGAYGEKAQHAGLLGKASLAGKARTALEKAAALDPKSLEARNGLVQFYSQAPGFLGGGMDKAHAQADAMIQLDPVRGRIAKAGLFLREKKYAEAFTLYDETLKVKPDDYGALYQLGRLAAESGQRLDRGLDALKKCLTLTPPAGQPPHAAAQWRLGNIFERLGDKAAARAAYEASLALDAKFAQAIEALKKLN